MDAGYILIIDDEAKLTQLLARIIGLEGYSVFTANDLQAGRKILAKEPIQVILCDVKLPDGSGLSFLEEIKRKSAQIELILLTAYGNISDGVAAIKNGAFDYLVKGDDNERIIPLVKRAFEKLKLQEKVELLKKRSQKNRGFESILGHSPSIMAAIELAKKVAVTDLNVMLLGETGSGKEVFARAIHEYSPRSKNEFLPLNCSAFTKDLLESELFGHRAGAFTGANKDKKGLIEEASEGTLFLDEVGEMPLELQAKLLRFLETNEFIKLGDTKPTKVNVRIITATNRILEAEVAAGNFRQDLYYRLNGFTIQLPPLRDRRKDIPELAQYFLIEYCQKINAPVKKMSPGFLKKLESHSWKGNIRELKNVMERATILSAGPELTLESLPFDLQFQSSESQDISSRFDWNQMERDHIQRVLHYTKGNKTEAARLMNIGLTTLYRKIDEYGIHA